MTLQLDERRLAMLAEMNLRFVRVPAQPAEAPPEPALARAPAPAGEAHAPAPAPVPGPQEVAGTADEETLAPAEWMLVIDAAGDADPTGPLAGDAGRLLDNMLRAIGLARDAGAHLAVLPAGGDTARIDAFLRHRLAGVQPKIVLAMGRFSAQALLGAGEAMGRLRGRVHAWDGVPVVVTYPPSYLLRNPAEKARAWADLCLALEALRGQGGAPSRSAAT